MTFWQIATGFRGRIARGTYWRVQLWLVPPIVLALVAIIALAAREAVPRPLIFVLAAGFVVVLGWSTLALFVKRLHDRGKGANYLGVFVVLPAALDAATQVASLEILAIPSMLLHLWSLWEVGLRRGQAGANRFGPDPLGESRGALPAE